MREFRVGAKCEEFVRPAVRLDGVPGVLQRLQLIPAQELCRCADQARSHKIGGRNSMLRKKWRSIQILRSLAIIKGDLERKLMTGIFRD
jgi:hypothetical protein